MITLMLFFTFTRFNITSSFFAISKVLGGMWCQKALITETFSKLSWTAHKVIYFNLIEKYVCAAYDPHNCLHAKLTGCGSFCIRSRVTTKWKSFPNKQFQILRSTYAAGWI